MLTLFSYPDLFGVADNNPYGLKVFAFLKLCGLEFRHVHIIDTKAAPRGQLPYIDDDGEILGDSDRIIAHLTRRNGLTIDGDLSREQLRTDLLLRRLLDDLYWVMSYSRWRDDAFWPLFRDEMLKTHAALAPTCSKRRGNIIFSVTTIRVSAATREATFMRAGSPISARWRK